MKLIIEHGSVVTLRQAVTKKGVPIEYITLSDGESMVNASAREISFAGDAAHPGVPLAWPVRIELEVRFSTWQGNQMMEIVGGSIVPLVPVAAPAGGNGRAS